MVLLLALAWAAGIALGDALGCGPRAALAVALVTAVAAGGALWGRRAALAAAALALAGGVAGQALRPRAPPALVDGTPSLIRGRVRDLVQRTLEGARVVVELESVERGGVVHRASGAVELHLPGAPLEPLLPGDAVAARVALRAPRGLLNPGAPDAARRAAARGVVAVGGLHDAAGLVRWAADPGPPVGQGPWARLRLGILRPLGLFRAAAVDRFTRLLPSEDAALLGALVLGERGGLGPEVEERYRRAGVSHVLSVSGLHLALATWLVFVGLTRLFLFVPALARGGPARRWAALAALPLSAAYALLTGAEPATLRALVVALVYLGGVALGRRARMAEALAVAALALLVWEPLELFDPSFQLSFAAALATSLLLPRLVRPGARPSTLLGRLGRWALALAATSLAALLGTLPLVARHFAELQPAGLITNLFVVPLAELVVLPLGLGAALLATAGLPGGEACARLAGFGAASLSSLVEGVAARVPELAVPSPSWLACALFWGGLLLLVRAGRRRLGLALVAAALLATVGPVVARRWSRTLEVLFVDVGQGDAALLFLPGGEVAVLDGGGSFDARVDPGRDVLVPLLRRHGVTRLALVILSHPHPDHANGLAALVEAFPVGEVWTNGAETTQPGTVRLVEAARRRGVPVVRPHPLTVGGARLSVLGPRDPSEPSQSVAVDPALGENDNSLVLLVEHAGRRLLFPGDVERDAERALVARGLPPVDVLKVPHHGSRTSSTAPFLDALRPTVAVASLGVRNRWGFPHPEVVTRYAARGATLWRTDLHGAVRLTVSSRGVLEVHAVRPP